MLDRVGHIGAAAVDAGLLDAAVEHLAGRADKRVAGEVFAVAWLLADEHDRSPPRPLAEYGLRGIGIERVSRRRLRQGGRERDIE